MLCLIRRGILVAAGRRKHLKQTQLLNITGNGRLRNGKAPFLELGCELLLGFHVKLFHQA